MSDTVRNILVWAPFAVAIGWIIGTTLGHRAARGTQRKG